MTEEEPVVRRRRPRSDRAASERAGSDRADVDPADVDRAAPDRAAPDRAASDRAASDRAASDRAGSERLSPEWSRSEQPASERSERAGSERVAGGRTSSERSSADRLPPDRTTSDRTTSDRAASDRNTSDRTASDRAASDRAASDRNTSARATSGRTPSDRTISGRTASGRSSSERTVSVRGRRVERGRSRRRDPRRGKIIRRRIVALAIVIGAVGLLYGVYFTPLLGIRSVQVLGTKDLTQKQVLDAAAVPAGAPMLTISLAAIRDRVAGLNRVASVNVSRSWPATVRIDVAERIAVGVIKEPDGAHLIDRTAKDFATVPAEPAGLPELELPHAAATDPTAVALVQVLLAVPDKIRAEILSVSAKSPNSVTLALSAGRTVRWGGFEDSPRKAAVLTALMTQPGKVYDVSSPQLATISNP